MPLSACDKLGPYEILSLIGAGGMGEVYKARDTRLDRTVAIKVSKEKFSERFEREARAVAALNHPNICQLYDVGPDYLVMEFVDGTPIAAVDSPRRLLDLTVQIADGMAAAHAANIGHRDLKPDNILVTKNGRVKILDFGLAKPLPSAGETISMTQPGTVLGTIAYMSPEQARGSANIGAQSDQFSFGLILYELVAGKRAFQRGSAAETMAAIIREDAEPLPASVAAPLRWVIERCLAKEPSERYDTTRDLYRDLRQIRERLSEIGSSEAKGAGPPQKRRGRLWVVPAAAMVGFLAATLWPIQPSPPPTVVPFSTEAEIEAAPAWSPKGDRIAYTADVNGILQVFTKTLGSSTPTQITHQTASCFDPFWSADGNHIYYTTGTFQGGDLWSVAVAGGEAQKVMAGVLRAVLSPDGKTMATLAPDAPGLFRLAFSSPPGAPPQPYRRPPLSGLRVSGNNTTLQFTPDGKYLGLFTAARGRNELWRIPLDGGPPEEMLSGGKLAAGATWSKFTWFRDNQRAIVDQQGFNASYLQLVDLRSGTRRPLTSHATTEMFPSLSPDGRTLAYTAGEAGYDIVEVPLDGTAPRAVIATSRDEVAPTWAPDGVRFAYSTDRSGAAEIWLRNRLDGSERLIAGKKDIGDVVQILDCAISPDGNRIAYRDVRQIIWISPLSGEAPVRLWEDPAGAPQRGSSWSPDGNWIAYYSIRDERTAVLKARGGANTQPELVAYTSQARPVFWSPRGDWIALDDAGGLHIISPDGKQDRIVSRKAFYTYGWSKDGAALYGITSDESQLLLGRIDIATQRETKITDLGPVPAAFDFGNATGQFPYRGFSLHPDGKSFLTSVRRVKMHIWLMTDFYRPTRLLERWWRR
jgi:serine/threonine protein kinase